MNDTEPESHLQPAVIAVIAVYVQLAVFGLCGNLWVMWTVLSQLLGCATGGRPHKPTIQSSAFIYLLLLSVVDLVSFLPIPLLVSDLVMLRWPFSLGICKFFYICEGVNKTLSPMVLTALSIDRYIAVCKPTLVWMRQTQFALFVVLVCVLLSMTFIVPIGVHAKIETMPLTPVVLVDKCTLRIRGYFDLAQAMACFVLPLMLICSVYTAILNKLYRHTRISSVGRKTSISLSRVVKCSVMVVAFYFICWTPYFTMQLHHSLAGDLMDDHETDDNSTSSYSPPQNHTQTNRIGDDPHHTKSPLNISAAVTTSAFEREEMPSVPIFLFYMLHALPYTQSAFNWLFYAFLNRNLRNSGRTANGVRSTASTLIADGNSNGSANGAPLWKNIQQMGSHLKAAGLDTGNLLLKNSPFRTRVKRPFRSATYLEKPTTLLVGANGHERASMLDLPVDRDAMSMDSPPRSISAAASVPPANTHNDASATSSIEWL